MFTYETIGNGLAIEITAPDGRTAFLQGDEAAELVDLLDAAETDEEEQAILAEYESVME